MDQGEITRLLSALRDGEQDAMDRLMPLVYDRLRALAHRQLKRLRPGQTLDTTALVNEAYLKLADRAEAGWSDRAHFLAAAALAMRHILVDHARRQAAQKRPGKENQVLLEEARFGAEERMAAIEILALDRALDSLAKISERLSRVVEMRFFGGLSAGEIGDALGVTERTVRRDWRKARAYLFRELSTTGA